MRNTILKIAKVKPQVTQKLIAMVKPYNTIKMDKLNTPTKKILQAK